MCTGTGTDRNNPGEKCGVLPRGGEEEVLAIGQKAAILAEAVNFVNLVQGEGLYGFDGIRRTAELMMEAYREGKRYRTTCSTKRDWGVRVLPMRQSYRIIPIYTADVSGVCSALYELGGMTVMHDPSGCNSTYNTHDEIRWYDQDSLIFISGLTEIDAILGNDRKFDLMISSMRSENCIPNSSHWQVLRSHL